MSSLAETLTVHDELARRLPLLLGKHLQSRDGRSEVNPYGKLRSRKEQRSKWTLIKNHCQIRN